MDRTENAILKTLCYSDIFNYPLTLEEIEKYLISDRKISKKNIENTVHKSKIIEGNGIYYALKGRKGLFETREKRERISNEKLKIARRMAFLISANPFVKMVGVSGGLALRNSEEKDDIDFFIVTGRGKIWTSRLFSIALLKIFKRHRNKYQKDVKNKICTNMFISEDNLSFDKSKRDLYLAHEIIQLKPVFSREKTYERFLWSNRWINEYLPNFKIKKIEAKKNKLGKIKMYEKISKNIQLRSIRKTLTTEFIEDNMLAFHPLNVRQKTLKKFRKRAETVLTRGH